MLANKLIALSKPNPEKLTSYECGEEPTGSAWLPFNSRFYVIALIFLLFDVEMIFIFPWATVYADKGLIAADARWGVFTLTEMFVFVGILILGLVYVWRKGDLDWIKSKPVAPTVQVKIPVSLYEKLNTDIGTYKVKAFNVDLEPEVAAEVVTAPAPARKPMFKPNFKKAADE